MRQYDGPRRSDWVGRGGASEFLHAHPPPLNLNLKAKVTVKQWGSTGFPKRVGFGWLVVSWSLFLLPRARARSRS